MGDKTILAISTLCGGFGIVAAMYLHRRMDAGITLEAA